LRGLAALGGAVTTIFAMRHGEVSDPNVMDKAAWDRVAKAASVGSGFFRGLAADTAGSILKESRGLMTGMFSHHLPYAHILSAIGERVQELRDALHLGVDVDTPPLVLKTPGWGTRS
jgi:hypothetical protein